nr:hypothetical protein CFP56_17657 [Quercus suber]
MMAVVDRRHATVEHGRGRQRSPSRRGVGKDFGSADVKDGIPKQSTNNQPEMEVLAMRTKNDTVKPNSSSCHNEGVSEISGAVPNFQRGDKVITRFHANMKGGSNVISGTSTDIQQCDEGVAHEGRFKFK